MNFELTDEQLMLREQAAGFLAKNCPPDKVRHALDDPSPHDDGLWQTIVELGWTAATIPEQYCGLELGYMSLAVIAEELGRALAPVPYSSSMYLGVDTRPLVIVDKF